MNLPYRKSTRLSNYDYSSVNYYFVTVCTDEKRCLFFTDGQINAIGKIVEECLLQIPQHFAGVRLDKYIVMPNQIHAILVTDEENNYELPTIVGQFKSSATKRIHEIIPHQKIWQRSFHDHVIRNQQGYEKIWGYIHTNLLNWNKDCFFPVEEGHAPPET